MKYNYLQGASEGTGFLQPERILGGLTLDKKRYRYLAAAVAFATSVAVLPGFAYAAEENNAAGQGESPVTSEELAQETPAAFLRDRDC